jgi:hypothetical protein
LLEKENAGAKDEEGEDFGGGEEGGDFGGAEEAPDVGAEEPVAAPESLQFDLKDLNKTTKVLTEWASIDDNIKKRYKDKLLRTKYK